MYGVYTRKGSKVAKRELLDVPLNVFELEKAGVEVNALNSGHGMGEVGASTNCFCYVCCSCSAPASGA